MANFVMRGSNARVLQMNGKVVQSSVGGNESPAAWFTYDTVNDNARIIGYTGPTGASLVLPTTLGGMPLYGIASGALANKDIRSITFPSRMLMLESGCCSGNTNLTSLLNLYEGTQCYDYAFTDAPITTIAIAGPTMPTVSIGIGNDDNHPLGIYTESFRSYYEGGGNEAGYRRGGTYTYSDSAWHWTGWHWTGVSGNVSIKVIDYQFAPFPSSAFKVVMDGTTEIFLTDENHMAIFSNVAAGSHEFTVVDTSTEDPMTFTYFNGSTHFTYGTMSIDLCIIPTMEYLYSSETGGNANPVPANSGVYKVAAAICNPVTMIDVDGNLFVPGGYSATPQYTITTSVYPAGIGYTYHVYGIVAPASGIATFAANNYAASEPMGLTLLGSFTPTTDGLQTPLVFDGATLPISNGTTCCFYLRSDAPVDTAVVLSDIEVAVTLTKN